MPSSMRTVRPVAVLAAFLLSNPAADAQAEVRYRPKRGETLRYELRIVQKSTTKEMDKETMNVHQQAIEMAWLVQAVDSKGYAKIQLKYERVTIAAESPDESVTVTSAAKDEPEKEPAKSMTAMAKALGRFVGTFTLSPRGEITDVTIAESALKDMKAVPGAEQFAAGWTEENLQRTLKDSMLLFPADPVAKGKTWTTDVEGRSALGKISGLVQYTYDGSVQQDGRTVEKFTVKPKLKIETDPKAEVPVTIKQYDSDGTAYFDNGAGRLVLFTTTQRVEIEAEVKDAKLVQKTEVTNSLKLLKAAK